ncbi:MAG: purine-nucleoside phosphorylase [Marinilabiliales bacterium]|nr:MAG: purine-nucleoside phosphorylase [Marinilabiliales bacterium]
MLEKIIQSAEYIKSKGIDGLDTGIILGTGLGSMVKHIDIEVSLDYKDIPNFPVSTVEFHSGKPIYGTLSGKKVLVMNGRFHFYEGYNMQEVTFPIRVMKLLGVENLLVSNACGGINPAFKPASLMIIDDHINMIPGNPLVGKNISELGPRFVDMSRPYDPELIKKMENIAKSNGIEINKGVYVSWIGPSLETRAEYRFIKIMGADVVGMSTVPEVIVANHMKMKVAAISVITDLCDPDNLEVANIDDILKNAAIAEKDLVLIFKQLVKEI